MGLRQMIVNELALRFPGSSPRDDTEQSHDDNDRGCRGSRDPSPSMALSFPQFGFCSIRRQSGFASRE
jgi:hypothetical protein